MIPPRYHTHLFVILPLSTHILHAGLLNDHEYNQNVDNGSILRFSAACWGICVKGLFLVEQLLADTLLICLIVTVIVKVAYFRRDPQFRPGSLSLA